MSDRKRSREMVATKSKNKVLSCSTPDRMLDSPSRDSDSETASPVPFLCTQDGGEGIADVVWNYYGTNSKTSQPKSSTPISTRKSRKRLKLKLPKKEQQPPLPNRKAIRPSQKKAQLPPELYELNQLVDKLMEKKATTVVSNQLQPQSGSEEDVFSDATDCSPESIFRNKGCLRKNVLSSKFSKPESENGLESDDSINECLFKASQVVEDIILKKGPIQQSYHEPNINPGLDPKINEDSMDAILKSIKSPFINKLKGASPKLKNDSFDSLVANLNDSALEQLTQMPVMNNPLSKKMDRNKTQDSNRTLQGPLINDASPSSRFSFTRHSSMPESPTITDQVRHSAMPLGRYSSMPFNDSNEKVTGDSPIRCTPLEIQKKRQQARERLLAKRLLPFTQSQNNSCNLALPITMQNNGNETQKIFKFQPKVPTSQFTNSKKPETITKPGIITKPEQTTLKQNTNPSMDLRLMIEKKRQEALMRLRRKQLQK